MTKSVGGRNPMRERSERRDGSREKLSILFTMIPLEPGTTSVRTGPGLRGYWGVLSISDHVGPVEP